MQRGKSWRPHALDPRPYKPPKLSECSPLFMAVRVLGSLTAPVRALYVWRAGLHGDADPQG